MDRILASANILTKIIGKPFHYKDKTFPDDGDKVDCCFGVKIGDAWTKVYDYKTGHCAGRRLFKNYLELFSVAYSREQSRQFLLCQNRVSFAID